MGKLEENKVLIHHHFKQEVNYMEKKKYYLSIHSSLGTVEMRDEKGEATYDFEIEATPEDTYQIEKLINKARETDVSLFMEPHYLPFGSDHIDKDNEKYDQTLDEIYHIIYKLGTPETQKQMDGMGILDALDGPSGGVVRGEIQ
jgi:hypothetical protein